MGSGIKLFITVLVVILVALIVIPLIITNTITAAVTTGIGSFAGVAALLGLVPLGGVVLLVWYVYNKMKSKGD